MADETRGARHLAENPDWRRAGWFVNKQVLKGRGFWEGLLGGGAGGRVLQLLRPVGSGMLARQEAYVQGFVGKGT